MDFGLLTMPQVAPLTPLEIAVGYACSSAAIGIVTGAAVAVPMLLFIDLPIASWPLLLFFAVGGPPFPGPAQTLLVSAVIGVSYILLNGVAASIGYGKTLPPAPAAWSPTLLYASLAGFFGLRLWRRL